MIKPTVGRVVWYWPHKDDHQIVKGGDQPLAAFVSHVWNDTCVNLAVFDANGVAFSRTSVLLVQEGNPVPDSNFAEWIPYQIGQAKKHEPKIEPDTQSEFPFLVQK